MGSVKRGFSFIEILVVVAVIAIVGTIIVPNIFQRRPHYARELFASQLNGLTRLAWQRALVSGRVQKVQAVLNQRTVELYAEIDDKNNHGKSTFVKAKDSSVRSSLVWPPRLVLKQFFIEGFDEMTRRAENTTNIFWFFVFPDGLAQSVIMNFIDTSDMIHGKPRQISFVLNPFSAQFDLYDTFQKP